MSTSTPTPLSIPKRLAPTPTAAGLWDQATAYLATLPGQPKPLILDHKGKSYFAIPIEFDSTENDEARAA